MGGCLSSWAVNGQILLAVLLALADRLDVFRDTERDTDSSAGELLIRHLRASVDQSSAAQRSTPLSLSLWQGPIRPLGVAVKNRGAEHRHLCATVPSTALR